MVDEYEEPQYDQSDNKSNLTSSLSSFFQNRLADSKDLDKETKAKLINYYKSFLKLSGYNLMDFESYLLKIDQSNPTDKSFYFSEFDDFYQTISSKNVSLIETLNEMYSERKNNFVNWSEFKSTFARLSNNVAWKVVEAKVTDINAIQKAIKWSEGSLKVVKNNAYYLDTLAQLYYKNNEKERAIVTEQKAIDAITDKLGSQLNDYKEVLEKMKNGTY
jgi:tetratricopeptide (TPR) repeat protein